MFNADGVCCYMFLRFEDIPTLGRCPEPGTCRLQVLLLVLTLNPAPAGHKSTSFLNPEHAAAAAAAAAIIVV